MTLVHRKPETPIIQRAVVGLFSAIAGALTVLAGFRYQALNWIVDAPGWIVSRFVSVDFHEGEGALGFFLAVFLTWGCAALVVFVIASYILRKIPFARFRHSNDQTT